MSYRILNTIGAVLTSAARERLETIGDIHDFTGSQQELAEALASADIALIGLGLNFSKNILEHAPHLRCIATATTGLDHIDTAEANARGITVLSLKGEEAFLRTITGTAELALGLMIDLSRDMSHAFEAVKKGQWQREHFRGHSLSGKTLGIVGLGRLGTLMARYGSTLGMTVIAVDPHKSTETFTNAGARGVDFSTLLQESDVISIHAALIPETEKLFNQEAFGEMKPTAYLINTARGQIVDEVALLQALEQGRIGGYAADVLADENTFGGQIPLQHPLLLYAKQHRHCILVPHIGGMTVESREATDTFMAEKIVAWATGTYKDA